jgi:hypothetical protein
MAKAVGLGGMFFKAKDPKALGAWNAKHLGISTTDTGSLVFDGAASACLTVFAHFPEDTRYFGEESQRAMVNFRVDNLDELLRSWPQNKSRSIPTAWISPTDASRGYTTRKAIAWSSGNRRKPASFAIAEG